MVKNHHFTIGDTSSFWVCFPASYVSLSERTPQKMFQVDHWLSPKFFGFCDLRPHFIEYKGKPATRTYIWGRHILDLDNYTSFQTMPMETLRDGELTPCHGTIWHPLEGPWSIFVDRYYINSISMDWFHSFHFPFIRIAHSTSSLISIPHLGIPYHAENTPRMASPHRREQLAEVGENTTPWKNTSTLNNTSASF